MRKKSSQEDTLQDAIDSLKSGKVEASMVLLLKDNGERSYLHPFDGEISALEFLELMVAGLRCDILETAIKRSVN